MESEVLSVSVSRRRSDVPLALAMGRGFLGRCPSCGRSLLFARYLEQVQCCPLCGAEFGRIRADDAAPWLTLIVVGHLFLPLIFIVNLAAFLPFWISVTCWAAFFCGVALLLLPRAKGLFIGMLWVTRAPGSESG